MDFSSVLDSSADFAFIRQAFLSGLLITVRVSLLASMLALFAGFVMAFLGLIPNKLCRWLVRAYVEGFRNTPLLIQLYLYYRGLQSIGMILAPEVCGILALGLYTGAYMTEVFRSGLLSIHQAQLLSGLALGMNRFQVYRMILLPQAIRIILPPLANQLIALTKNSSLVAFITVTDLFYVIYKGAVDEFRPFEYFVVGASIYVFLSLSIATVTQLLDWLIEHHWLRYPTVMSRQELDQLCQKGGVA